MRIFWTVFLFTTTVRATEIKPVTRDVAERVARSISNELGHRPFPLSRTRVSLWSYPVASGVAANGSSTIPAVVLHPETLHSLDQLRLIFGETRDDVLISYRLSSDPSTSVTDHLMIDTEDPGPLIRDLADIFYSVSGVARVTGARSSEGSPQIVVTVDDESSLQTLRSLWPEGSKIRQFDLVFVLAPKTPASPTDGACGGGLS